jgi:hypothetical protein
MWTGTAADGFHKAAADIPRSLETGAASLRKAGDALARWAGQLHVNQIEADKLEAEMAAANAAQNTGIQAMEHAWPGGDPTVQTGPPAYQQAAAAYKRAYDTGNAVYRKAYDLLQKHTAQAEAAANAVRAAGANDPFEPTQHESSGFGLLDVVTSVAGFASQGFGLLASVAALVPPAEEAAGVFETASGLSGVVSGIGGTTQLATGDPNAPSLLQLPLDVLPSLGGAVGDARALAAQRDAGSLGDAFAAKTRAGLAARSRTQGGHLSEAQHVARGREMSHGDARAAVASGAATVAQQATGQGGNPVVGSGVGGIGVVVNPKKRQLGKAALNAAQQPW